MTHILWAALRSLTAREIISALIRDGFSLQNQRGSHQRYRHADGRRVTVTYHRPGDTFPMGTLRSMIEIQARLDRSEPPAPFSSPLKPRHENPRPKRQMMPASTRAGIARLNLRDAAQVRTAYAEILASAKAYLNALPLDGGGLGGGDRAGGAANPPYPSPPRSRGRE